MFKKLILFALSAILTAGCMLPTVTAYSADENPSATDSEALSKKLMEKLSESEHPYILFTKDDIPSLKKKTESGMSKKAYKIVKATAEKALSSTLSVDESSKGVIGRQLQYNIAYLTIYGILADDERFINKAVDLAVSLAEQGSVDLYFRINDALCVGDFGHAYALAYDWLYDYMTEDQRKLVKTELEEIGAWIYEKSPEIDTWGADTPNRKAWNWNAVAHGALGLISLALGEHPEWMQLAIERTQGYYKYAVDGTGAAMESLHYIGYALNSLAPFDGAIYNLTGVELLDDYPAMQSMPYWSMAMTAPHGGEQAAINQGDSLGNYSGPYYIINRYRQSDALWGWEHTYNLHGDNDFSTEYQGNGWSAPAIILFEDQSLMATEPTPETTPLIKTYDKGLVIARDSWAEDASMMTFTCGYGFGGCWNHPDDNSFTFYAGGDSFIIDLGSGKLTSKEHNVISEDGAGMKYNGGSTMIEGTIEENNILENGALYLRGNNAESYTNIKLAASLRHLVYQGGDTPYVIAFDYARKDAKSHEYATNFYTKSGNKVAIDESGSFATITGANRGTVCYVIPFSPDGVDISVTEGANKGLTTVNTAAIHRQVTVFITAESDGTMPEVDFSTQGKTTTVSITRIQCGEQVTETYEFSLDSLLSPSAKAETEITTDTVAEEKTEAVPETAATTEEITTEVESATQHDSLIESNPETETEDTEATGSPNEPSGCGATVGASCIPAAIAGAATMILKRKKTKR